MLSIFDHRKQSCSLSRWVQPSHISCLLPSLSHGMLSEGFGNLQGPSPDEVALVEGGRQLGFEFVSRNRTTITVKMLGDEVSVKTA